MATPTPRTYTGKGRIIHAFREMAGCRRKALGELPADFFVFFLKNVLIELKTNHYYADTLTQYDDATNANTSNPRLAAMAEAQVIDMTINIFNGTCKELNINNSNLESIYKEYLYKNKWVLYTIYWMYKHAIK